MGKRSRRTPSEPKRPKLTAGSAQSRRRVGRTALLLAAAAVLLYAPTWHYGFAGDDSFVISNNHWSRQGLSALPHVVAHSLYFGAVPLNGGLYRPVAGAYYVIIGSLVSLDPTGYHVAQILLYGVNAAIVFWFFAALKRDSLALPIVATLVFVVHPIHTEVVNNIKSADEMLCLAAFLASAIAWLAYADTGMKPWAYASVAAYALAVCAKETAVPMVVVLPALWYFFRDRKVLPSLAAATPFLAVALLYLGLRHLVLAREPSTDIVTILNNALLGTSLSSVRLASAMAYLGRYLRMLVWPHPLSFDYSYDAIPLHTFADPVVWLSIGVWLLLCAAFVSGAPKRRIEAFAVVWLAASLVAVSNLLFLISTNFGERLLYLPSVIFSYVVADVLFRAARVTAATAPRAALQSPVIAVPLLIIVAVGGTAVLVRTRAWRDQLALFGADQRTFPNSARLNDYLGNLLYFAGERLLAQSPDQAARDFEESKACLRRGLAINGQFTEMDGALGMAEYQLRQCKDAIPDLQRSLEYQTYRASALEMMADCYEIQGDHARSLELLRQIDAEGITYPHGWFTLANDAALHGDEDKSIYYFSKVIRATPRNTAARYDLAAAEFRKGDLAAALASAQQCDAPPAAPPAQARCLMLAADSLAHMGRRDEAMQYVERAHVIDPNVR